MQSLYLLHLLLHLLPLLPHTQPLNHPPYPLPLYYVVLFINTPPPPPFLRLFLLDLEVLPHAEVRLGGLVLGLLVNHGHTQTIVKLRYKTALVGGLGRR